MPLDSPSPILRTSSSRPFTALRRYAFDEGDERVDCGSAVVVAPAEGPEDRAFPALSPSAAEEDFSIAQAKQFLAGGPVTLGWVTESPSAGGSVYVYCWVTIGD